MAHYILADGRQAPCIGTVQGLQVQIYGVSSIIDATVFDHCQFNLLMGRKTMKVFCITTHYETDLWTICCGEQCAELDMSYSKEVDFLCPSFNLDSFGKAYLCTTVTDNLDRNKALTPDQAHQFHSLLDGFNECIVKDLDNNLMFKFFGQRQVIKDVEPIAGMPYPIPHSCEQFVREEIA
ncbi:hypothetical protein DSO57_1025969 [Entomophthora muscae]|uniref:Uncharacterized protein n=1 Tax=Entomophthora muscae TaxID=34485 RepID=A0ACC2TD45_9FUNG|nr:hypothetical protein DSO57_1025969 [Entomophthora muscae]